MSNKKSKDLLSFLFLESAEAEAAELDISENLERIFEAAAEEEQGELKSKKTPLVKALAEFGIGDSDLQLDPYGFSLATDNRERYEDIVAVLGTADAMHKLAEMGWVVTKPGDPAMTNEPPGYRLRFLEITTVDKNDREPKAGTYDTANREEVIKKAQEFATTPMDRDDKLNPVDDETGKPDSLEKSTKRKGVGDPKDGKEAEHSIHDAIESGDIDKLIEMTTTGSMGSVDAGPQYTPAEGIIKKPKPYGKGTKFHMPGQWKVKQPIVKGQEKRHPHSESVVSEGPVADKIKKMQQTGWINPKKKSQQPRPATEGVLDYVDSIRSKLDEARSAAAQNADGQLKEIIEHGHGRYVGSCGHTIQNCRCSSRIPHPTINVAAPCRECYEALGAGKPEGTECPQQMTAEEFLNETPPARTDDFGSGQYDYMGQDDRFPLHVQKAKQFLEAGDRHNAAQHARAAINIGARGYIGTPLYMEAEEVLRQATQ